ncbi:MAG: ABC transporter permease [Candidatus Helarchaeota archaeon]
MKESLWKIQKYGAFTIFFVILSIFLFLMLIVPIFNIIFQESFAAIINAMFADYVGAAIITSFYCSFLATLLTFSFGIPLSYLLARYNFYGKNVIDSVIDLPILIPHSVAGIILLSIYGQNGIYGQFFSMLNISFTDTPWGIIVAMFFVSSPFLIKEARSSFEMVNPNFEKAARTLGASRSKTFLTVTMPIASRGIFTGCILCWARGISEFGAVYILASTPHVGATLIYHQFLGSGLEGARPIAIALILITFVVLIVLKYFQGKPEPKTQVI